MMWRFIGATETDCFRIHMFVPLQKEKPMENTLLRWLRTSHNRTVWNGIVQQCISGGYAYLYNVHSLISYFIYITYSPRNLVCVCRCRCFSVNAAKYAQMNWPTEVAGETYEYFPPTAHHPFVFVSEFCVQNCKSLFATPAARLVSKDFVF